MEHGICGKEVEAKRIDVLFGLQNMADFGHHVVLDALPLWPK